MRRGAAATDREKPKGENADDRDARLEDFYTYDRQGERSTMAFVSRYRDELTAEFFAWREREYQTGRTTGEGIFDGFRRWQVSRFGAQLDNGPHGVLLFWVRCQLAPEHGGRKIPAGYFDRPAVNVTGLPSNVSRAVGTIKRPGLSRRATDERLTELREQVKGLQLDTDGVA